MKRFVTNPGGNMVFFGDDVKRKILVSRPFANTWEAGSEVRGQKSEVSEDRSQRSEVRGQRSEVRRQKSEVRSQRSEVRGQKTEVRRQKSGLLFEG
jgi:hypothetical protein